MIKDKIDEVLREAFLAGWMAYYEDSSPNFSAFENWQKKKADEYKKLREMIERGANDTH